METKTITNLNGLFVEEIARLLGIELKLKQVLPVWINKTHNLLLKNMLRDYLHHIEGNTDALKNYVSVECEGINEIPDKILQAFIDETSGKLEACDPHMLDALLLASVQSISHFKISTYGTAAAWANLLELNDIAFSLHDAIINEKRNDERLGYLANREINNKARAPLALTQ